MALTDAQLQADIILKLGDTNDGRIAARMPVIWQLYASKGLIPSAPLLQYWMATREAIDTWLAYVKEQVSTSVSGEESVQLQEKTNNLRQLRNDVDAEIAIIEEQSHANRGAVSMMITQTTPETPPITQPIPTILTPPDANASWYRGSPYWNLRRA